MVNMLRHIQGSVNVNRETFDVAFERNVITVRLASFFVYLVQR